MTDLIDEALEEASRGFYAFNLFKRRLLGFRWFRSRDGWQLLGPDRPEILEQLREHLPEIRRRIVECELAHRFLIDERAAVIRECTVNWKAGFGSDGMVICPTTWADMDGPMWDEIRSWPEYHLRSQPKLPKVYTGAAGYAPTVQPKAIKQETEIERQRRVIAERREESRLLLRAVMRA